MTKNTLKITENRRKWRSFKMEEMDEIEGSWMTKIVGLV
jgi:hypothetical protein